MPDTTALSFYDGGPLSLARTDLWSWLALEGMKRPHSTALVAMHQGPDHLSQLLSPLSRSTNTAHFSWTFKELITAASRLAFFFTSNGIRPDDVVTTFVDNSVEWALFFWASIHCGATFSPLDPTLLRREEDLLEAEATLHPKVVLVKNADDMRQYDTFNGRAKVKLVCESLGPLQADASGWMALENLPDGDHLSVRPYKSSLEDFVVILFTSGSTNTPKGCQITVSGLVAEIRSYLSFWGSQWNRDSKFLVTSMCFRPICYLGCFNSWQRGGAAVFSARGFDVGKTIETITALGCTHMMLVPTQLNMLAKSAILQTQRPETLKMVTVSGDMVDAEMLESAKKELRIQKVIFHWGMTEGAPVFGWVVDETVPLAAGGIPGLGRPLPGSAAKICAEGSLNVVPRGVNGDLHVKSRCMIKSYLRNRSKEDFYHDADGAWFKTGDTAYMDDSGIVYVVGRSKDLIKCHGVGLVPSLIEECLRRSFGIEVYVVGTSDPVCGAKAIAVVKDCSIDDSLRSKMVARVPEALGHGYWLADAVALPDIGLQDWPYNSSGKVVKRELASAIETSRASKT